MLALLGFACPTTHSRPGGPVAAGGSLRRRVPCPGFGYPPHGVHRQAYRHGTCRSVPGLHPSRPSPRPRSVLLSEPVPSWRSRRPRRRPPGGARRRRTRPSSGPCSRGESVLPPGSRRALAVDAFLGFTPPERRPGRPGERIERVASPHALRAARRQRTRGAPGSRGNRPRRRVRLRTASSRGVVDLLTAQRSVRRSAKAGSWVRLTPRREAAGRSKPCGRRRNRQSRDRCPALAPCGHTVGDLVLSSVLVSQRARPFRASPGIATRGPLDLPPRANSRPPAQTRAGGGSAADPAGRRGARPQSARRRIGKPGSRPVRGKAVEPRRNPLARKHLRAGNALDAGWESGFPAVLIGFSTGCGQTPAPGVGAGGPARDPDPAAPPRGGSPTPRGSPRGAGRRPASCCTGCGGSPRRARRRAPGGP